MAEPQTHLAPQNAVPLGFMKQKGNLTFFVFGRDYIINFVTIQANNFFGYPIRASSIA
jgi:hypothetical protein